MAIYIVCTDTKSRDLNEILASNVGAPVDRSLFCAGDVIHLFDAPYKIFRWQYKVTASDVGKEKKEQAKRKKATFAPEIEDNSIQVELDD